MYCTKLLRVYLLKSMLCATSVFHKITIVFKIKKICLEEAHRSKHLSIHTWSFCIPSAKAIKANRSGWWSKVTWSPISARGTGAAIDTALVIGFRRLQIVIKQIASNKPNTPAPVAIEMRTALPLLTSTENINKNIKMS